MYATLPPDFGCNAKTLISPSSRASSCSSIAFKKGDDEPEIVRLEGLRHAAYRLEARHYKSGTFRQKLIDVVNMLRIPTWYNLQVPPGSVDVYKVSGSLTNAVFFVSCPSNPRIRTLLLRIYGPSSGNLISRPQELQTLHVLSSQYHIGPKVYGTFENGRIEEYFNATALTAADLRNPQVSRWIGARMAELHQVDIEIVQGPSPSGYEDCPKTNVKSWILPAKNVLALPAVTDSDRSRINLNSFLRQWERYHHWLAETESEEGASRRVFSHNDTQYGNLLRLVNRDQGVPEHRQLIVVDFEYASSNAAAFDIANHFNEWTYNYHGPAPHIPDPAAYPTLEERRNFYSAYVTHSYPSLSKSEKNRMMDELEKQVRAWTPASHGMWAMWGIVQAKDDLEADGAGITPEFDYLGYSERRLGAFRHAIDALGIPL